MNLPAETKDEQLVLLEEPPGWVAAVAVCIYVVACTVPAVLTTVLLSDLGVGNVAAGLVAVAVLIATVRLSAARAGRAWDLLCTWRARRSAQDKERE
jgi:hypothetical protein